MCPELGTLEWIKFNPDFLIRISTVKIFHFCPNPLFFSLLGYPLKGVFAKNERGYRLNTIKKRF